MCCGARDCAVKVAGTIAAVVGGYRVDATFRLKGDPSSDYRVKEFVPYAGGVAVAGRRLLALPMGRFAQVFFRAAAEHLKNQTWEISR